ncbi:MAG: hypothetical protein ACEQSF_02735 [Solirubrobacteraceae bacterium]
MKDGELIPTEKQLEIKNCDFGLLLLASPSLANFFLKCTKKYDFIDDGTLTDDDFERLANFEMVLRMYINNILNIERRVRLEEIINFLGHEFKMNVEEILILQKGRRFLNMIKGHKSKFNNFEEGFRSFTEALNILDKYKIIINE